MRRPEAVASRFIGDSNALNLAPGFADLVAPTMQQLQQRVFSVIHASS